MYDAFDLNGSGHLGSSERALMHEVFSGSDATGKGFYRNSQKENTQNTTHRQSDSGPYHFHHREKNPVWTTIGYGALFILLMGASVLVLGQLWSAVDFSSGVGIFVGLIFAGPLSLLFLTVDFIMIQGVYDEIKGWVRDIKKRLKEHSCPKGTILRKITYMNFILAFDILLIAGVLFAFDKAVIIKEQFEIRAQEAEEQEALQQRITTGRCIVGRCEKHVLPGSPYCRMHTCEEPGCTNAVAAFDRCDMHKAGYVETSAFAVEECVADGCLEPKTAGSPYCTTHRPVVVSGISDTSAELSKPTQTTPKPSLSNRQYERTIDDQDIDLYYEDYRNEFEDIDDAWDDLEDNEDEWDDY